MLSNTEKHRAYRAANRDAYNARMRGYAADRKQKRQFVAIDSEGVSYGERISIGDDFGRIQRTIFWGAATADSSPRFLTGKPFCTAAEIIDWLLDLTQQFPNSIFIWFGSSYDATQIFCGLPYQKAWELQHGKSFADRNDGRKGVSGRYVLWGRYALSYIKQKCVKIAELRDPENPRDGKGNFNFARSIIIYDVFGFFQTSFLKAAKSIPGSITEKEKAIIEAGKQQRGEFSLDQRDEMMTYTAAELNVLARMMTLLRESLEGLDLRLSRWQGAGSIAASLMQQKKARDHFYDVRVKDISREQQWAHHAFFGGRIECLKQGVTKKRLYSYDVRSAYPFHMSRLPSMAGGVFRHVVNPTQSDVQTANVLSMFRVRLQTEVDMSPLRLNQIYGVAGPEFYPFPYRDGGGRIVYPPNVHGIYMAEEVRAAFEWLAYYSAHFENRARNSFVFPCSIVVEEALIFEPAPGAGEPFAWLADMYQQRRDIVARAEATGEYDLTEKVIKLGINSVYGKTAQSVGSGDRPPGTACPWYAAAITAGTRAQLLRAAISRAVGSIVAFQTDGIVTTAPLSIGEGSALGAWEKEIIDGTSFFVQPGIYHLGKKSKHRGIKMDLLGVPTFEGWLQDHLPKAWATGTEDIDYAYRYYVTLGNAVASEERWKFAGYWVDGKRRLQTDNLGFKRAAPIFSSDKKRRSDGLVDTVPKPAFYHAEETPDDLPLSKAHTPHWLDLGFGQSAELALLNEEISLTNGSDICSQFEALFPQ